jgi:hypothetical protein
MATKRKPASESDLKALQSLYDTMLDFLSKMKTQATAANKDEQIIVRKSFEKYITGVSNDLAKIESRIRRISNALYRRETAALVAELEGNEEAQEEEEAEQ